MTDDQKSGGYFSRNYVKRKGPCVDDSRARFRIATYLREYHDSDSVRTGAYIEKELGIEAVSSGYNSYVNWEQLITESSINDFLDIITAIIRIKPTARIRRDMRSQTVSLGKFVERVFREQNLAYRLDEHGGVHPFIDAAFSGEISELTRNLSDDNLTAARTNLEMAETALLANVFDGRAAVRSAFDAVENLFKLICTNCNQLNNKNIETHLRQNLVDHSSLSKHEKDSTGKLVNGLKSWVEAAHLFRHEPGQTEPTAPSETFAIQFVSQGLGYIRWLSSVYVESAKD